MSGAKLANASAELLAGGPRLAARLEIVDWVMVRSRNDHAGPLDVAFVEGVVATQRDLRNLRAIRARSKVLVAIGTCAVWGGVAAMDRGADRGKMLEEVYGERGREYDSYPAQSLHELVKVDFNITGCPTFLLDSAVAVVECFGLNPQ